ncbi:MAG TPA: hypothetical protein DDW34_00440 [Clostridium sp.]|jgi:hypothetical protein|uniref:DUF4367 domain-containing protein n=4 Tax=root TaxID=1 RepID=A0A0X1U803_ANAPI|nr:hypothetical protein [Anaerotignum propionicum]AMJ41061.1 hypothetical protein CPRO_14680 [Anaerotignum propionicum DSM 1682]MEA5056165.1 hypothetical protein [Anaerotignum propionicum]SHE62529.1 hypothetical protein SAMN02745151_01279 [[Clostridium] propionicum DSM 1682] [Anaerotignum propionicum DSM 1682]HBF64477.1 hypothetical protein [Clostridium sp.]
MKSPENFEDKLRKAIYAEADKICPSEDMFLQINRKIKNKNMEEKNMKLFSIKKTRGILVACMLLAFTSITCFAAAKIVSYTSHSTNSTFAEFPSEKEVKKEAGFVPKYVNELAGGYAFYNGGIGETNAETEDGSAVVTLKTANFSYKNGDSTVNLLVENGIMPSADENGEIVKISANVEGRYHSDMYKILPPDYVMTEQDKADAESGKYVFSYGSEEVEVLHMQQIQWEDNGMSYSLINSDDKVDKDVLVKMAGEIVNK